MDAEPEKARSTVHFHKKIQSLDAASFGELKLILQEGKPRRNRVNSYSQRERPR
jgi:hypothetical protein